MHKTSEALFDQDIAETLNHAAERLGIAHRLAHTPDMWEVANMVACILEALSQQLKPADKPAANALPAHGEQPQA